MIKLILPLLIFCSTVYAQPDSSKNSIAIIHEQNHFDKQFSNPWFATSLQYKRKMHFGTAIARVTAANRFNKSGMQFEAEAYPKLGKKAYAYVAAAYSNDVPVFSKWRTGATVYLPLSKGWEPEIGYRQLHFDQSIWLGTAGVSKYAGSWLLNVRSFFSTKTPLSNGSVFITARKYFKNENDYLWLQAGKGISPDEGRNIQLNNGGELSSSRIAAGAKCSLTKKLQAQLSAGWSRDNYATNTFGNQYFGSAGLDIKF